MWVGYMYSRHPDVVKKDPWAVKLGGALILEHVAKVFYNEYDNPPATLFLVLVGGPRTGKGAVLREAARVARELGVRVIGDVTPEALVEELSRNPNTIQVWEDVGYILARRGIKDCYAGLDKILNNLYNLSSISQRRKVSKSITLEGRSYLFSFLWDTNLEEWGVVESLLGGPKGFSRRVLPVKMSGERLPRFSYGGGLEGCKQMAEMKDVADQLRDVCFYVDLKVLGDSDVKEEVGRRLEALGFGDYEEDRMYDYTNKLTALTVVDWIIGEAIATCSALYDGGYRQLFSVIEGRQREWLKVRKVASDPPLLNLPSQPNSITTYNLQVADPELASRAALTIFNHLASARLSVFEDEDVQRYAELTRKALEEKPVISKREWWHKVMKGRKKQFVDEMLRTLNGLGVALVRGVGMATYLVNPTAKICGTCRWFQAPKCKAGTSPDNLVELLSARAREDCYEPLQL
jgi:hypothetical protein